MFSDNFSAIDPVVAEIWYSEVGLLVSSGLLCTAWPVNTLKLCAYASSQKSFSRLNEATVELPSCFKMFLVPLGTFSKWFDSRKRGFFF